MHGPSPPTRDPAPSVHTTNGESAAIFCCALVSVPRHPIRRSKKLSVQKRSKALSSQATHSRDSRNGCRVVERVTSGVGGCRTIPSGPHVVPEGCVRGDHTASSNWFYGLIAVYYQSRLMNEEKSYISPILSTCTPSRISLPSRQLCELAPRGLRHVKAERRDYALLRVVRTTQVLGGGSRVSICLGVGYLQSGSRLCTRSSLFFIRLDLRLKVAV